MLSILFKILSLALLIWLLRRFLAAILSKTGSGKPASNFPKSAQKMVKDPVCGMYMDSRLAVRIEEGREVVYFCSEDCRNKYLKKPPDEGAGPAAAG
jgi:YHS domain-containing protein